MRSTNHRRFTSRGRRARSFGALPLCSPRVSRRRPSRDSRIRDSGRPLFNQVALPHRRWRGGRRSRCGRRNLARCLSRSRPGSRSRPRCRSRGWRGHEVGAHGGPHVECRLCEQIERIDLGAGARFGRRRCDGNDHARVLWAGLVLGDGGCGSLSRVSLCSEREEPERGKHNRCEEEKKDDGDHPDRARAAGPFCRDSRIGGRWWGRNECS